jgi:riboflavin biosynthesis pyrimidine reductase
MYEDLRKAAGDDPMPFTFDELLNWARPLEMVVDHRNKTPETMEVLQNEWTAKGLVVRSAPLHRSFEINKLKRKLE